jgi:hypothetical protein
LRKLPHEYPVVAILKHEHQLPWVETTVNNMMLAGIPPRAGGVSGHRLGVCAVFGQWASEVRRRRGMKGRLVAFVGVFCIAILVVSGANADKPDRGKPPGPTKLEKELIVFKDGDLEGAQVVEGCCLNRGPAPEYEMTLPHGLGEPGDTTYCPSGTYTGHLFMNYWGAGRAQEFLVRFRGTNENLDYISIEIIGGEIDRNKKTKVLTVTFTNDDCWVLEDECPRAPCGEHIAYVNFTLVRTPL